MVFGSDPGIPEAKATTAKGVARLFQGGGGAGPSALPARRARPATVTDPATGLALPTTLKLPLPSAAAGAGAPEAAAEVALLGCGVKVKKLGFVEINVYSVGVYAQPAGLKAALAPWHRGGAAGGAALFDGLLSKVGAPPAAVPPPWRAARAAPGPEPPPTHTRHRRRMRNRRLVPWGLTWHGCALPFPAPPRILCPLTSGRN